MNYLTLVFKNKDNVVGKETFNDDEVGHSLIQKRLSNFDKYNYTLVSIKHCEVIETDVTDNYV